MAKSGVAAKVSYRRALLQSLTAQKCSSDAHPLESCATVTEYLASMPSIAERVRKILSKEVRILSDGTNDRIINILQGEIAHATVSQADILVSDHATTCHILAVRSTLCTSANLAQGEGGSTPLVSLCHIDMPGYNRCLKSMVELHKRHHRGKMFMDFHIVGGFSDRNGSSLSITEHLMEFIGRLAQEEGLCIQPTIKTCAVSCLNSDGSSGPIGRGMAIDVRTGEVYIAKVNPSVAGPATELRGARLWASSRDETERLSIIHTPASDGIAVEPFQFGNEDFKAYIALSDEDLLLATSTSPDAEEEDFCDQARRSMKFLQSNDTEKVFGYRGCTPLRFRRSDQNANKWCLR